MLPRFIHSNMTGAPVVATTVGSLLSIVDAVLRTGFNIKTPSSVVVASGVATYTYLAAHGYEDKCWIRTAGAGDTAVNIDANCTVISTTVLTVSVPGAVDGTVSGTIDTRVAPIGWERPFTGTNVSVYRSPDTNSTRMFYQFDDTNAAEQTQIKLRGYESMTSDSVGVDPFPTTLQLANGCRMIKGTSTPWAVIGDTKTVYFYCGSVPHGANYHGIVPFGDFVSYKPADAFAAFLSGNDSNSTGYMSQSGGQQSHYVARMADGIIKSGYVGKAGYVNGNSGGYGRPYPNLVHGGMTISRPIHMLEGNGSVAPIRGHLRGAMYVHEYVPTFPWLIVTNLQNIPGRVVLLPDGAGSVAFPVDEEWV